jgi:hypothetical protein
MGRRVSDNRVGFITLTCWPRVGKAKRAPEMCGRVAQRRAPCDTSRCSRSIGPGASQCAAALQRCSGSGLPRYPRPPRKRVDLGRPPLAQGPERGCMTLLRVPRAYQASWAARVRCRSTFASRLPYVRLRRSCRRIGTIRSSLRCAKEKLRLEAKVNERPQFRLRQISECRTAPASFFTKARVNVLLHV